jgi:hypothetical protein
VVGAVCHAARRYISSASSSLIAWLCRDRLDSSAQYGSHPPGCIIVVHLPVRQVANSVDSRRPVPRSDRAKWPLRQTLAARDRPPRTLEVTRTDAIRPRHDVPSGQFRGPSTNRHHEARIVPNGQFAGRTARLPTAEITAPSTSAPAQRAKWPISPDCGARRIVGRAALSGRRVGPAQNRPNGQFSTQGHGPGSALSNDSAGRPGSPQAASLESAKWLSSVVRWRRISRRSRAGQTPPVQ